MHESNRQKEEDGKEVRKLYTCRMLDSTMDLYPWPAMIPSSLPLPQLEYL